MVIDSIFCRVKVDLVPNFTWTSLVVPRMIIGAWRGDLVAWKDNLAGWKDGLVGWNDDLVGWNDDLVG